MRSSSVIKLVTGCYLVLFFVYLFLPLVFMSLVAFNSSTIPQVTPWEGFTLKWFGVLIDDKQMWDGLINSFIVAFFVVIISVPIGLAASLLLTRLQFKASNSFYAILVSPLLMPGIIIGISTFLFWDTAFQVSGGLLTTIMAQSTFISGYCMLLIMARAQRFNTTQEDAAFDLGATHKQVFFKITLPFLKPALISAAALAFMQSFENYNTTLFAIGFEQTLPIYIGSKLRSFISPAMNALAFIFILITITGAVVYEVMRRREAIKK
ncbi:MAG: ABC transporter permease [Desulfocapsa sp.]|uniref:ABC transporter permease n=1 Tax=Desulfotalea psychrophila TaxID=84980 RepID=A0ABS3AYC7_9BACT|nr:ABC transporter permease [Desulfocapsa sp.]MBN4048706.1 ABC transporter permease [bacterium AH-315-N22]MBN4068882.1 ABC transporter permease [Desulfotalea psychrophila]